MERQYDHPQKDFMTHNGKMTTVDEGVYDLMILMRDLGIKTQYSCEDNQITGQAYVVMSMRSWFKFKRLILRSTFQRHLLSAKRTIEFSLFSSKGSYRWVITTVYLTQPKRHRVDYRVEHTISNAYGFRTTVRWPSKDTELILKALQDHKEK